MTASAVLADHLLAEYAMAMLPASAFGEEAAALRALVATALLYGYAAELRDWPFEQRRISVSLPWIAASLRRLDQVLARLAP